MEFTEEQIIAGINNRKNEVFEFLEKRIKRSILAHVTLNSGTDEDAEDCYHDSVCVLIKMAERQGFECTCKVTTLLFEIAKTQWQQKLDRRGPASNYKIRHNEDTLVEVDEDELDKPLYKKILDDCWKKLSRECRQILKAYMNGMKGEEMADVFDYTPNTIRKKKCLCHSMLRKLVHEHPDYERIKREDDIL